MLVVEALEVSKVTSVSKCWSASTSLRSGGMAALFSFFALCAFAASPPQVLTALRTVRGAGEVSFASPSAAAAVLAMLAGASMLSFSMLRIVETRPKGPSLVVASP